MIPCYQIQFQFSGETLRFRDKEYIMGAVGIPSFEIFPQEILSRVGYRYNFKYRYKDYTINIKKSDYGRSKLYKNAHSLTLYVALSSRDDFLTDEKCEFIMEQKCLDVVLYAICQFNYNMCLTCTNTGCTHKTNVNEPLEKILSDELFEI